MLIVAVYRLCGSQASNTPTTVTPTPSRTFGRAIRLRLMLGRGTRLPKTFIPV